MTQPIRPPERVNYSAQALKASETLMAEDDLEILTADRARLKQEAAVGVFTLGQALSLSPDVVRELHDKLAERQAGMLPAYHQYLNQLIGAAATTLMGQVGFNPQIVSPAETSAGNNLLMAFVTEAQTPQAALPEGQEPEATPDGAESPENDKAATGDASTREEGNVLVLPDNIAFMDYERIPANMSSFLKRVFPDLSAKIDKLTPRIASLMSYQLLEQYSKAKIPHVVVDKKTEHRYRIERYIGLHEPPVHAIDLHRSLGISDASFYTGMARIVKWMNETQNSQEVLRIATATLISGAISDKFTYKPVTGGKNTPNPADAAPSGGQPETGQAAETRKFYDHSRTPASMSNFLIGIYPNDYNDRLLTLGPKPACVLTQRLLSVFSSLELPALDDATRTKRTKWLEQWTGLYTSPRDPGFIAKSCTVPAVPTQTVNNNITSTIRLLQKSVPTEQLIQMYDEVIAGL